MLQLPPTIQGQATRRKTLAKVQLGHWLAIETWLVRIYSLAVFHTLNSMVITFELTRPPIANPHVDIGCRLLTRHWATCVLYHISHWNISHVLCIHLSVNYTNSLPVLISSISSFPRWHFSLLFARLGCGFLSFVFASQHLPWLCHTSVLHISYAEDALKPLQMEIGRVSTTLLGIPASRLGILLGVWSKIE